MSTNTTTFNSETFNASTEENIQGLLISHNLDTTAIHVSIMNDNKRRITPAKIKEIDKNNVFVEVDYTGGEWTVVVARERARIPEDDVHGWNTSVWTGKQEDLHIQPLQKLAELTRPAATEVGIYGYGGMIWTSQDDLDDPSSPDPDKEHGWGARYDGDVEETLYAMENLDGFWVDYDKISYDGGGD